MTSAVNLVATRLGESRQSNSKADKQGGEDQFGSTLAKEMAPKAPADGSAEPQKNTVPAKDASAKPADADTPTEAVETTEAAPAQTVESWLAMLQNMQLPIAQPKSADTGKAGDKLAALSGKDDKLALLAGGKEAALGDALLDKSKKDGGGIDLARLIGGDAQAAKAEEIAVLGKTLPDDIGKSSKDLAADFASQLNHHSAQLGQKSASADVAAAAVAKAPSHHVQETVGDSRWGDAVAQRVSLMLNKQEQHLEMQLNPPNLGPMEVKLTMAGDQASVTFTSQQASVREALAAATPKLTALLADQGITLANVQVASDSLNQQAQQQQQAGQFQQQSDAREQARQRVFGGGDNLIDKTVMQTAVWTDMKLPVARGGLNLYV
ncbi:hypothetical protein IGB42_02450 [Andreprevotia sp. IGB-42]|uniref:flagellar hook-length control protein FliK n=1 Tax=Andreprevotia sp. IGB-42 TaxID=2497473 RepID=UPI00135C719F|nr:flagellar hook-length control protein FliK [Andreprevotia sp. IGB-42]KAF0813054.1 hypothetical protein IGB42_02450 [Andreprevotia sp. IGB-42]